MNLEFIAILDFAFGGGWWKINEQEFISESILLLSYVVLISLANLCRGRQRRKRIEVVQGSDRILSLFFREFIQFT